MTTGKTLNGKPYAGNSHVWFDEWEVASCTAEASLRRKSKCFSVLVAAFFLQSAVFADIVTINPGDGVATNVQQRITGATDVVVNSGADGGGIVTLNPYNTYTGSTTLGCGTLVATALGGGAGSSFGSTSGLTLGAGTFRYAGADGGSFAAPIASTVSSTTATVLDIQNDLSISGGYTQTDGAFIKTGAGTLTVAGGDNLFDASTLTSPANTSIGYANTVAPLNLNANGDAPTQGYAGFTVAEGTFRIAGGRNALGANLYTQVGVQGTDAKDATLEIAGGENWLATYFVVCPPRNVEGARAGVRITGGTTTLGNRQSVYLGCANEVRNNNYAPDGEYEAFFEMTGGTFSAPSSDSSFFIGLAGKGKINVDIAGGTLALGKNLAFNYGDAIGRATNDVTFTIRDGGTVAASNAIYMAATPVQESVNRLNIIDGGKLSVANAYVSYPNNDSSSPNNNEMHIFIDGGTYEALSRSEDYAMLPQAFAKNDVLIGTKGATFCYSSSSTTVVVRITANLAATNSVPGMEPKGVTFAKSGTKPAYINISTPGAWAGPTVIAADTTLGLYSGSSALPAASDVTVNGTLSITRSGTVTVGRSLTVNGTVKMYTGATLALDGPISGDGKLLLYSNSGLTSSSWTDGNTYPFITAPVSAKDSLVAFAKNCRFGVPPASNSGKTLGFVVTDDGTTATLSMKYYATISIGSIGDDDYGMMSTEKDGMVATTLTRLYVDAGYATPTPHTGRFSAFRMDSGDVTVFNEESVKMAQLGTNNELSGNFEAVMTLNGGTLHVPGNFSMSLDQAAKQGYATVVVNGGNLEIGGNLYPNYIPTAAAVGNSITLNSGTISCNYLRCSASTSSGTYRPATITLNGGLFSAAQLVDLCYQSAAKNAGAGSLLYLNSGATLRTPGIQPTQSGTGAGKVYFNGGTLQVTLTSGINCYVQNCEAVYVGEGGAIVDMSLNKGGQNVSKYINLKQPFLHDPNCAGTDGGVTIFGEGLADCGSGFANSTFTGPIVVRDNGHFMAHKSALTGHDLFIKPTCLFRQYQNTEFPTVNDLTLGEVGAAAPVMLKAYRKNTASVPMLKVEGALNVLSPVLVGATTSWETSMTIDSVGVYTTLVYKAESSNVDLSLFRGYPTEGKTATFEIVDSAYAGYKAVVMTVENGTDPNAIATYSKVNGEWTLSSSVGGLNRLLSVPSGTSAVFGGDSLDDFDGILYINAEQSEENRGTSGAVSFGADSFDSFGGILYPRSGTVTIPSLAWMTDFTQLRLGFGTVKYTGTGETIPGFQTYATGSYMATLEIDNDLKVDGKVSAGPYGAFMKAGAGTLTFKGTGSYALGNQHNSAYYWGSPSIAGRPENFRCENGDSPTNAVMNLSVGEGTLVVGEAGDETDAPQVTTSAYAAIGLPASGDNDAEMIINSGSLGITKYDFYLGYYHGLDIPVKAKLTLNGGTVSVARSILTAYGQASTCHPEITVNGGTLNVGNAVEMSWGHANRSVAVSSDTTSKFTINGGEVNVATNFYVVYRDSASERANNGRLYLNGGVLDVKGTLFVTRNSKTTAEAWLNEGGLLKAGDITGTRTGGKFYFNGGTFIPYGVLPNGNAAATFADSSLDTLVSTNGVVVDTSSVAGGTYTIAAALKHDPDLAGADGGLVKKGTGTLALSGTNTYDGVTVVEEGTLLVAGDAAVPGLAYVNYGTTLDLDGGARTVGGIAGAGVVQNGTLVIGGLMPISGELPFLDCHLATVKGAAIDFGRTEANPVPYGTKVVVAQLTGHAVGTLHFKARNAGCDCALDVTVEDGFVYVTTKGKGVKIVIR